MAFLISVFGCTILIMKIWEKWQTSPVIVSFAEKSTPVWQIPFPAGKDFSLIYLNINSPPLLSHNLS
jgi:hypothetical protein